MLTIWRIVLGKEACLAQVGSSFGDGRPSTLVTVTSRQEKQGRKRLEHTLEAVDSSIQESHWHFVRNQCISKYCLQ